MFIKFSGSRGILSAAVIYKIQILGSFIWYKNLHSKNFYIFIFD